MVFVQAKLSYKTFIIYDFSYKERAINFAQYFHPRQIFLESEWSRALKRSILGNYYLTHKDYIGVVMFGIVKSSSLLQHKECESHISRVRVE